MRDMTKLQFGFVSAATFLVCALLIAGCGKQDDTKGTSGAERAENVSSESAAACGGSSQPKVPAQQAEALSAKNGSGVDSQKQESEANKKPFVAGYNHALK